MVAYKVLESKVGIDLAFFLILILFSLVTLGKEFCATQNFLQPKRKFLNTYISNFFYFYYYFFFWT